MKKRFAILVILLWLCSCTAGALAEPVLAFTAAELASDESKGDASDVTEPYKFYFSASELLNIFTGTDVPLGEAEYIDGKSSLSLSYEVGLSADSVRLVIPKDSSCIFVYANGLPEHEAKNGVTVSWVPLYAEHEGERKYFSSCDIDGYDYRADLPTDGTTDGEVTVTYDGLFSFSKEAVNEIASFAYNAAIIACGRIDEKNAEYSALLSEYNAQSNLYEQYLLDMADYEAKAAAYSTYLEECETVQKRYDDAVREYEALMAEYEASKAEYDALLAAYEADVKAYGQKLSDYEYYINVTKPKYEKEYSEYLAYLDALDDYEEKYSKYEEYRENADRYLAHLEILNTSKTPMTDGRSLYDAIMGGTVDTVLNRKDEIIAAGAPKALVDSAGRSTTKLRALFKSYFDLSTDEDRYSFYKRYYTEFKSNLLDLLQALDYFYGMDLVYTKLTDEEKGKKYVILLAQLYIITSAICDEKIYDYEGKTEFTDSYTWTYAMSRADQNAGRTYTVTPISVLEGKRYLVDTDSATPYTDPFPQYEEKPVKPQEVPVPVPPEKCTEPTEPVPPEEPIPPIAVQEPQMPTEVAKPEEPTRVSHPGEQPQPYVPTEEEAQLAELMNSGALVVREELDAACLTREYTLSKKLVQDGEATVYFYSSRDNGSLLYVTVADTGPSVSFSGDAPTKPSDEKYHYLFDGWEHEDGRRADLDSIGTGHIYLYPIFKSFDKNSSFTVTWNIDGKKYVTYCKYGETPTFGAIPQKEKDDDYVYTFDSWDREPVSATADAEYTAIFKKTKYYKISWLVDGVAVAESECLENETPRFPLGVPTKDDDIGGRYTFIGWKGGLKSATEDTSYEAEFAVTPFYTVSWTVGGETVLQTRCLEGEMPEFTLGVPTKADDANGRYTFIGWKGGLKSATEDTSYEAEFAVTPFYTVSWIVGGETVLQTKCLAGETPSFGGEVPTKESDGAYRYEFRGWDRALESATEDTSYEAVFDAIRLYTVSWYSDGRLIGKTKCDEGAIPVPPEIPTRELGKLYKYTFIGWSNEPTRAYADAEYDAVFKEEYIYPCGNGGAELTYSYGKLKLSTVGCGGNGISNLAALAELAAGRYLIIETPLGNLGISAETLNVMLDDGICKITLDLKDGGYYVSVEDGQGTASSERDERYSIIAELVSDSVIAPAAGGRMHAVAIGEDGKTSIIDSVISEKSFTVGGIKSNTVYKCVEFFDINISDGIDWISVKNSAAAGEHVELSLDLPLGMKLKSMYYVSENSAGERVAITDGTFAMPQGGVWIYASLQPIEFTVKFVYYDGSVIEKTCKWGEIPEPTVFSEEIDSDRIYKFISWDREIVAAYADAVYTAVYEVTPIDSGSTARSNFWLLYLITVYRYRYLLIASAVISVASAAAFVTVRILKKRHGVFRDRF